MQTRSLNLISVVAPVFDEEETIAEFARRVRGSLSELPFELVMVDDGSRDSTADLLEGLAAEDPRVRVISLSRNFGHQAALTAGLDHARGDAVVMMDADLQDPPELIPVLLERWREGFDVVSGVREARAGETMFKLATARWFYRLFAKLTQIDLQPEVAEFRLLDRSALDALNSMRERNRFLRGMAVWVGFRQTTVSYERDARYGGKTKFTTRKMVVLAIDALSSFSHVPLQLATVLGFVFAMVAFVGISAAIAFELAGQFVPGIATVLLVVLLLGGVQLITLGIIGEYLGRVYDEVKQRPLYVVRQRPNVSAPNEREANRTDQLEV